MDLKSFGNGKVTFENGREEEPKTTTVAGNVTTHNHGRPAIKPCFMVDFSIRATSVVEGHEESLSAVLTLSVAAPHHDISYRQVEDEAAQRVPDVLRQLADQIEAQNKEISANLKGGDD